MSHENPRLYAEGEVDDDAYEEQSVTPEVVIERGEVALTLKQVSFTVKDGIPQATIEGVDISGYFDADKNPLQALLNNFDSTNKQ